MGPPSYRSSYRSTVAERTNETVPTALEWLSDSPRRLENQDHCSSKGRVHLVDPNAERLDSRVEGFPHCLRVGLATVEVTGRHSVDGLKLRDGRRGRGGQD